MPGSKSPDSGPDQVGDVLTLIESIQTTFEELLQTGHFLEANEQSDLIVALVRKLDANLPAPTEEHLLRFRNIADRITKSVSELEDLKAKQQKSRSISKRAIDGYSKK